MRHVLTLLTAITCSCTLADYPPDRLPPIDRSDESEDDDPLPAPEECDATWACLDTCDDPCSLACLEGCWLPSPDCLGTACVVDLACEACP